MITALGDYDTSRLLIEVSSRVQELENKCSDLKMMVRTFEGERDDLRSQAAEQQRRFGEEVESLQEALARVTLERDRLLEANTRLIEHNRALQENPPQVLQAFPHGNGVTLGTTATLATVAQLNELEGRLMGELKKLESKIQGLTRIYMGGQP